MIIIIIMVGMIIIGAIIGIIFLIIGASTSRKNNMMVRKMCKHDEEYPYHVNCEDNYTPRKPTSKPYYPKCCNENILGRYY